MYKPENDFSWLTQHEPEEYDEVYSDLTEGIRSELTRIAFDAKSRFIARCFQQKHFNAYIDLEIGDDEPPTSTLIIEYEIDGKLRKTQKRIHEADTFTTYQIEAVLKQLSEDIRLTLADILIYDCITGICTMAAGSEITSMNTFELVSEFDESLPAQLHELHKNIRAGTLPKPRAH